MNNRRERENYSWELIQDMIDKEVSSAFKLRIPLKKDREGNNLGTYHRKMDTCFRTGSVLYSKFSTYSE